MFLLNSPILTRAKRARNRINVGGGGGSVPPGVKNLRGETSGGEHRVENSGGGWKALAPYFDNFFPSCNFIRELGAKGLKVTGTIRKNRVENCPLPSADDMKKKPHGSYAFKSDGDIELMLWNDVTLCSKALGLEPIGQAKRWKGGQFVNIDQPCEIKHYKDCT